MLSIQERLALPSEPIAGAAWQWACMLRCAIPGKVLSFDPVKQTCVVQILIQETVWKSPPSTPSSPLPGTANIPTPETIKPLKDVPIFMMRVPGWSITLPITPGTECLLVFADMCIDGWWQSGEISAQMRRRRHHLSDAFALFGPWSQPNNLENYSTTSMQIRSDDQTVVIDLAPGTVTITAPTVNVVASTALALTAPSIKMGAAGGTEGGLVNDNFYQWFIATYMPSVRYVTVAPPLPVNPETTVVKGQ